VLRDRERLGSDLELARLPDRRPAAVPAGARAGPRALAPGDPLGSHPLEPRHLRRGSGTGHRRGRDLPPEREPRGVELAGRRGVPAVLRARAAPQNAGAATASAPGAENVSDSAVWID